MKKTKAARSRKICRVTRRNVRRSKSENAMEMTKSILASSPMRTSEHRLSSNGSIYPVATVARAWYPIVRQVDERPFS